VGFAGADAFAVKLSAAGEALYAYAYGGDGDDHGLAICAAPTGETYVAGDVTGFWTYGPAPEDHFHDGGGGQEVFVLLLSP
jgi:hypothetical protein